MNILLVEPSLEGVLKLYVHGLVPGIGGVLFSVSYGHLNRFFAEVQKKIGQVVVVGVFAILPFKLQARDRTWICAFEWITHNLSDQKIVRDLLPVLANVV